ncbi:hypothetical protein AAKU67_002209 [Oxalobacteraceae bacterium GrIS 2.11]
MMLDALMQFSGSVNPTVGQSLALAAGTYNSTNVIDLAGVGVGNTGRDLGQGGELEIAVEVNTTFTGGTSLQCQLVCSDDAATSVNVTPIVISPVILTAALTAGNQLILHVDRASMAAVARRYLTLQYVIVGAMTAGAVSSFIIRNPQDKGNNTLFNSGFAIS